MTSISCSRPPIPTYKVPEHVTSQLKTRAKSPKSRPASATSRRAETVPPKQVETPLTKRKEVTVGAGRKLNREQSLERKISNTAVESSLSDIFQKSRVSNNCSQSGEPHRSSDRKQETPHDRVKVNGEMKTVMVGIKVLSVLIFALLQICSF